MLEQLLNEIEELKKYKEKYEHAEKDKERMSDYIYEEELNKFKEKVYEVRANIYREDICKCCRFNDGCNLKDCLPEDIGEPIKNKGWMPGYKTCGNFEWD